MLSLILQDRIKKDPPSLRVKLCLDLTSLILRNVQEHVIWMLFCIKSVGKWMPSASSWTLVQTFTPVELLNGECMGGVIKKYRFKVEKGTKGDIFRHIALCPILYLFSDPATSLDSKFSAFHLLSASSVLPRGIFGFPWSRARSPSANLITVITSNL